MGGCDQVQAAIQRSLVRWDRCNDRNPVLSIRSYCRGDGAYWREVDKIARLSKEMLFQSLTVPHAGFAAQDINCRFMSLMLVRLGACPGGWSLFAGGYSVHPPNAPKYQGRSGELVCR
jgi:hypothetical protein